MNSASPFRDHVLPLLGTLARWALGCLFIYMGLKKALDPVDFLKLVRQYDMVHSSLLLNLIAAALPWFEVFCGGLLLGGIAVRGAAALSLLMLVPFTLIVLQRALAIQAAQGLPFCAIRFDCGCGAGEVAICFKLAENSLLILLSALFVVWRNDRWALKHTLFK
jgi:uncharacterized membrane protein YphA (DoxX/SURF4 family)